MIPDDFLWEVSLTRLDLSAESVVAQIEGGFLMACTSLTSIDLSGLIHVTHIGDCFLSGCSALCTLDLTPFSSVTQIKSCFLAGCSSLCSLELTSLSSVTRIGHSFLYACSSLRTLDLSPLSSVTEISSFFFLYGCTSLESIYLTGCSDVVSSTVREQELWHLVIESRPKRSRDEPLEESRKRLRHAETPPAAHCDLEAARHTPSQATPPAKHCRQQSWKRCCSGCGRAGVSYATATGGWPGVCTKGGTVFCVSLCFCLSPSSLPCLHQISKDSPHIPSPLFIVLHQEHDLIWDFSSEDSV